MARQIQLELLPHERAALLKWNLTIDEDQDQLDPCASSPDAEAIRFTAADIHFLAGELNHAIVKRGCRNEAHSFPSIQVIFTLDIVKRVGF